MSLKSYLERALPIPVVDRLRSLYRHGMRLQQGLQRDDGLLVKWTFSSRRILSQQRMRAFKDLHRGHRCFIIGNGPSLNRTDLSRLQGEVTFGMNRIYLLFPKLGFTTSYLVSVNQLVLEQCAEEIARLPMTKFISWRALGFPVQSPSTVFFRSEGGVGFSEDPSGRVFESATVTNVALQLAYYMGFEEVVLVGVDHSFTSRGKPNSTVVSGGDDANHFDPSYFGKGFRWQLPDLETSERGYWLARQKFEQEGRSVFDATVDGKLEIFPKVHYEDLFKGGR